jgi:hypothetical protein
VDAPERIFMPVRSMKWSAFWALRVFEAADSFGVPGPYARLCIWTYENLPSRYFGE